MTRIQEAVNSKQQQRPRRFQARAEKGFSYFQARDRCSIFVSAQRYEPELELVLQVLAVDVVMTDLLSTPMLLQAQYELRAQVSCAMRDHAKI